MSGIQSQATLTSFPIQHGVARITALHTLFRQTFPKDYRFQGEIHHFWELVCVLDGKVSITADDQVFTLEKGEAILHPPMQFHNIGSLGDSSPTVFIVTFSGENIPFICNKTCRLHDLSRVKELYHLACRTFDIREYWVVNTLDDSNRSLRFARELELLLLQLSDHTGKLKQLKSRGATQYSMIVKNIEENLDKRLTAAQLAKLCNLSEVGLQKAFSKYAGMGIMQYYNRLQMQYATRLLSEGHSVKEVAAMIGFSGQSYFSTVYKRITGTTPSQNQWKNKTRKTNHHQ